MPDIKIVILGLIGIDLVIMYLKNYMKVKMKEEKISWKLIGILQIPIVIIIYLFFFSFEIMFIILIFAIIICIALGFYFNYKSKKSATEPIEAEIIDINSITTHSNYDNVHNITTTIYTLTLKYIVNGVEYINKNTIGYKELDENMIIGNKIIIKYNPKNPNDICY